MKPTTAVFLAAAATSGGGGTTGPTAKQVIERLRAGGDFHGNDQEAFVVNGALDDASVTLLIDAFRDSTGDPKNELARALVAAGRWGDALRPQGGDALRDPRILKALVEIGLSRQDPAKEVCLDAMIKNVPPALLAPYGDALAASLAAAPDETTALAVAKAKPKGGLAALATATASAKWLGESRDATLLRAALGDAKAEKSVLDAFAAEKKDGARKAKLARELGLIGTPAALRALGAEMRSPLTYETPSSIARSFRLDVMEALLFPFPEELAFYPNRINSDADYVAAEAAAEKRTGAKLTGPRPPFLTQNGRPF